MNNQHRAHEADNTPHDGGQETADHSAFTEAAKRVGEQLVALRESRGLSVEDISARLKVSTIKLKALEAGTWNELPEMPFIQGVVRGYARMLGADPAPMIEILRPFGRRAPIEIPPPASNGVSIPRSPVHFRSPAGNNGVLSRWIWLAGVIAAIAVGGWWYGSHRKAETAAMPLDVASAPTAQPGAEASAPVAKESAASTVAAYQPLAAASAVPESAAPASASVTAAKEIPANASQAAQTADAASPTSAAGVASAASAAGAAGAIANGEAKLHLQFSGESWVEVRSGDGKILLSQLLKAGAAQDVAGAPPLKVIIGNVAGVAAIEFNGQPVELKSSGAGNVARLTLK